MIDGCLTVSVQKKIITYLLHEMHNVLFIIDGSIEGSL